MNILYLCGSGRSAGYTMRQWADMNSPLIAYLDTKFGVARLKSGDTVYFYTYDQPDMLRGMEFSMVFEDGERITADHRYVEETRLLVRAQLRRQAGPFEVKTPPAKFI